MTPIYLFILMGLLSWPTLSASSPIGESELQAVSQSRYWRLLLHMRPSFLSGERSHAGGREFFFAENGSRDSLAELKATIVAFSQNRKVGFLQQHPQCAFPERFRFLKESLKLQIPEIQCTEFENWKIAFAADSATLVYSASYPNSPASTFGHTFLRINSSKKNTSKTRQDLLDYGINYAASTNDSMGIQFALRGLVGGYEGNFGVSPYYMKVNEYNNSENRDLWEYDLQLSGDQVNRLIGHLWELRTNAQISYYFIDENCSYQILALLEIANPDWHLIDDLPFYVTPSDTVKAVARQAGAIQGVHFRPSQYKKMMSQFNRLSSSERRRLFSIIEAQESVATEKNVRVIDAALAHFNFRKYRTLDHLPPNEAKSFHDLLVRRSQIETSTALEAEAWGMEDQGSRPDQSHHSLQVGSSSGAVKDEFAQDFHFRMGLHDFLNEDVGLPPNSVLEWFNFTARYYASKRKLALDSIDLIHVKSVFPIDRFQRDFSWGGHIQYRTPKDMSCLTCKSAFASAYGGAALQWARAWTAYTFVGGYTDIGSPFRLGYRYGPFWEVGQIFEARRNWKFHLSAQLNGDLGQTDRKQNFWEFRFEQGYSLSQSWDLRTKIYYIPVANEFEPYSEWWIGANYYFF